MYMFIYSVHCTCTILWHLSQVLVILVYGLIIESPNRLRHNFKLGISVRIFSYRISLFALKLVTGVTTMVITTVTEQEP